MPVRFYIKPNRRDGSASILVAENLDYETTRFFTLRVRVQNVAAVPLASFTTVYVNITGERYPSGNYNSIIFKHKYKYHNFEVSCFFFYVI